MIDNLFSVPLVSAVLILAIALVFPVVLGLIYIRENLIVKQQLGKALAHTSVRCWRLNATELGEAPTVTFQVLRTLIPEKCFHPSLWISAAYILADVALIFALQVTIINTSAFYIKIPVALLLGLALISIYAVGHDAAHGSFSRRRIVNSTIGILCHGMLLIPYRTRQRSHALHHMYTGHLDREEAFKARRADEPESLQSFLMRSIVFIPIRWPLYLLGFGRGSNWYSLKGSHFSPTSDLYTSSIAVSFWFSNLSVAVALGVYIWVLMQFGFSVFLWSVLIPYLVFSSALTIISYLQHVAPEIPVYSSEDWSKLKAALATVDQSYFPFDKLFHNLGNEHVIHHLFPTIPHYRLKLARESIMPVIGDRYLSSRRFFAISMFRSIRRCRFVVPAKGFEKYVTSKGAYDKGVASTANQS